MEEEDSYSYFSKIFLLCSLGSQFAMAPEAYFQNGSFKEFSEQKVYPTTLQGLISDQLNSPIERVKPLVPKFDEPYKKVKIEDNLTETEVKTEESEGVNSPEYQKTFNTLINPIREETVLRLEKESTISPKISQIQDTLDYNSFRNATASKDDTCTIKKEEFDVVPVKAKIKLETFVVSRKNWGKRDLKKFRKFQEFYKTYQEKLNIDSPLVSDKFQQISTIAIPKLSTHFKSKPFEAVCAAILLYACREVNYPITLKQILSIADSKDKLINKCVFSLQEILPWNTETKHFKAGEFIKLLTDKLKVNDSVRIAANKIWENIEELGLVKGTHAMTLAACCVKFACSLSNADKSFDTLAIAAETTKTTLKSVYRELFPYRFKFITKDCKLGDPKELKAL